MVNWTNRLVLGTALVGTLLCGADGASAQTAGIGDCQPNQYVDRTAAGADRGIDWGFGISGDPERCMKVQVGETVTWNGDLDSHPLGSSGGDQPNPISAHSNGAVTFTKAGTFGFICLSHSSMKGAIFVVAAPPAPRGYAAPASPGWALTLLVAALAVVGTVLLRRRSGLLG